MINNPIPTSQRSDGGADPKGDVTTGGGVGVGIGISTGVLMSDPGKSMIRKTRHPVTTLMISR
jgi:hypothetical protein